MDPLRFDFDAPIAPSASTVARHCSSMGALDAQERIARQCLAILTLYREQGPLSDADVAEQLGIERTSVNARRRELMRRGLVVAIDTAKNPRTHIRNTRWGFRSDTTATR